MKILGIIVGLAMLFMLTACDMTPAEPLVTGECTDATGTSLTANAKVNKLEAGTLSRRGFVFMEGTAGEPEFSTITLVNASFENGEEGEPPEGWELSHGGGTTWERSDEHVRVGSYSVKLSVTTNYGSIVQDIAGYEEYRGKTVTFGAWVYHPTVADGVYLHVFDGVTHTTSFSSTATDWEWLTVTAYVDSDATKLSVRLRVSESRAPNSSGWFDGAVLVENAVLEDGQFGTGAYSLEITRLKPDTSYRVRAFVADLQGVRYGNTVTCNTLP